MDRHSHPKFMATFIPSIPPADTFLQGRKESLTSYPLLDTGITNLVYDFNGNINGTGNITTFGKIQGIYYSNDGSEGITNTANYHVCTSWAGSNCNGWCTLRIKNGLIVGCA